jgi:hypothetical protein
MVKDLIPILFPTFPKWKETHNDSQHPFFNPDIMETVFCGSVHVAIDH